MTIHWKAVEQYFTVVLFGFQVSTVCNFEKFINFGLGTVRSEGLKTCKRVGQPTGQRNTNSAVQTSRSTLLTLFFGRDLRFANKCQLQMVVTEIYVRCWNNERTAHCNIIFHVCHFVNFISFRLGTVRRLAAATVPLQLRLKSLSETNRQSSRFKLWLFFGPQPLSDYQRILRKFLLCGHGLTTHSLQPCCKVVFVLAVAQL